MFGVELVFFRRCFLLAPLFLLVGSANGQQLTSLNHWEGNFHFLKHWIDPFFSSHTQPPIVAEDSDDHLEAQHMAAGIDTSDNKLAVEKQMSVQVFEGADVSSSPDQGKRMIKYSSSNSTAIYRVPLDKQMDEYYHGKPVFMDAKGVKYIIDSKYKKQIIK